MSEVDVSRLEWTATPRSDVPLDGDTTWEIDLGERPGENDAEGIEGRDTGRG
jgi:hypothetical protein